MKRKGQMSLFTEGMNALLAFQWGIRIFSPQNSCLCNYKIAE